MLTLSDLSNADVLLCNAAMHEWHSMAVLPWHVQKQLTLAELM